MKEIKEASMQSSDIKVIIADLNKKFGAGTAVLGATLLKNKLERFSSGSLELDLSLGGGWPEGRIIEIIGAESVGKTFLCIQAAREFQRKYKNAIVLLFDLENVNIDSLDWWKTCGVDLNRLVLIPPDIGERVADMAIELFRNKAIKKLAIMDSVAAITPGSEDSDSAEKQSMGVHARLMNKFMRKAVVAMRSSLEEEADTTLILTNQIRSKIGVMFGNPETTPGGMGIRFSASIRLNLRRADYLHSGKTKASTTIGQIVAFRPTKNKTFQPSTSGQYALYFANYSVRGKVVNYKGSISNANVVRKYGIAYGLIKKTGRNYTAFGKILGTTKDDIDFTLATNTVIQKLLIQSIKSKYRKFGGLNDGVEE